MVEVVGKYQPVSPFLIVGLLFGRKPGWPDDYTKSVTCRVEPMDKTRWVNSRSRYSQGANSGKSRHGFGVSIHVEEKQAWNRGGGDLR